MRLNIWKSKGDGTFETEQVEFGLPLPHCDQSILHAPGACQFCDKYPEAQALREHWRINFTGDRNENRAPCPSEYFRPAKVRDRWPGNTPEGFIND